MFSRLPDRESFVIVRSLAELLVDATELRARVRRNALPLPVLLAVSVLLCDAREVLDCDSDFDRLFSGMCASSLSDVL